MRNNLSIFSILLIFSSTVAFSQFNVTRFLESSPTNTELNIVSEQIAYFENNNFNSPWLREVEFRMRVSNLEEGLNDYRVRLSPLNPFEVKANKNHKDLIGKQLELQRQVSLSELLKSRYTMIVRILSLQEEMNLEKQNLKTLDQLKLLAKEDKSDLVKIDFDLTKSKIRLIEYEGRLSELITELKIYYPFDGKILINFDQIIGVEEIRSRLMENDKLEFNSILYENKKLEMEIEKSELNIRETESFSNIGFVQAEFRERRGETFNEQFGIQFGFTIPIVNPDRPDLQVRRLNMIEEEQNLSIYKLKIDKEVQQIENQLDVLFKKWDLLNSKNSEINNLLDLNTTDLEFLFELIIYQQALNQRLAEARYAITLNYLEWLELSGLLVSSPLRNHLSKASEQLEIQY